MFIISYDIQNDGSRTRFSKFLKKFGHKVQYSVYELRNSNRVLQNVIRQIELSFAKDFKLTDNVLIFPVCEGCKKRILRYGSAIHDEEKVVVFK